MNIIDRISPMLTEKGITFTTTMSGNACVASWSQETANGPRWFLKTFVGKTNRARNYYSFRTSEKCAAYATQFLGDMEQRAQSKVTEQAAKKAEKASIDCRVDFPIGTILASSWGYEQTNVNFFVVVFHKSRTRLIIQPICQTTVETTSWASGNVMPDPSRDYGKPLTVTQLSKDKVTRPDLRCDVTADRFCGRPMHSSSYA